MKIKILIISSSSILLPSGSSEVDMKSLDRTIGGEINGEDNMSNGGPSNTNNSTTINSNTVLSSQTTDKDVPVSVSAADDNFKFRKLFRTMKSKLKLQELCIRCRYVRLDLRKVFTCHQ